MSVACELCFQHMTHIVIAAMKEKHEEDTGKMKVKFLSP
jgi:hypothetical protein